MALDIQPATIYFFSIMKMSQTEKAWTLATAFQRSYERHQKSFADFGPHATLATFATMADLDFKPSPVIINYASQILQTLNIPTK